MTLTKTCQLRFIAEQTKPHSKERTMRILTAIALMLVTGLVMAADLTKKDVERWLAHAPDLHSWVEQQENEFDEDALPEDIFDQDAMAKYGVQQLKQAGLYGELDRRVKAAGYSSVEHWITDSQKISMAYMAITLENEKGKDQGTMSEILAQKEELAGLNMPEESKAMMEAMLDGALAMLQTVEATSSADKAAVKPYFNEVGEILGDED